MNRIKLSNIPLKDYMNFLSDMGCSKVADGTKGRGGHEKWIKDGLFRPITLQTHVDPVPEIVVRSNLRTLGLTRKQLEDWLLKNK